MNNEKIKKYGADKIFLLGLFVCSLLAALLIVKARRVIHLTKPVELPYSGLSIQMPDKNGWESDTKWVYKDNSFILSSVFAANRIQQTNVLCTYQLTSARKSASQWFDEFLSKTETQVTQTGKISGLNITFDWVYIEDSTNFPGLIAATANLGYGRWLDINIINNGETFEFNHKVLKKIVQSSKYEGNKLLNNGVELVKEIKNKGLSYYLSFHQKPATYLIKNKANQDAGFLIEAILGENEQDTDIQVQSAAYLRLSVLTNRRMPFRRDNFIDEGTFFQSDNYLDEYLLNHQSNQSDQVRISVSNKNLAQIQTTAKDYELMLGPAAIAGTAIDAVYSYMILNDIKRVVVDILSSRGSLIPVVISKIENSLDKKRDIHIFELAYTNENYFEKVYLNKNFQTIKKEIQDNDIYLFIEILPTEELIRKFPERAEFIVERIRTIESTIL